MAPKLAFWFKGRFAGYNFDSLEIDMHEVYLIVMQWLSVIYFNKTEFNFVGFCFTWLNIARLYYSGTRKNIRISTQNGIEYLATSDESWKSTLSVIQSCDQKEQVLLLTIQHVWMSQVARQ